MDEYIAALAELTELRAVLKRVKEQRLEDGDWAVVVRLIERDNAALEQLGRSMGLCDDEDVPQAESGAAERSS